MTEVECKTTTTDDKCCSLPFTYKGVTYKSCTKIGHNKLWCSLDTSYKGRWGNCGKYQNDDMINYHSKANAHQGFGLGFSLLCDSFSNSKVCAYLKKWGESFSGHL